VTERGLEFLLKSQRADGSWPIDTNLSTWCSTLAANALPFAQLCALHSQLAPWLLRQQYTAEHPYTHAAPGGWAWTDLPGGVPDADDTAGALIVLHCLSYEHTLNAPQRKEICLAAKAGIHWLLDLQNRDGGMPTFCRGWGALQFDRSSADITAHAIRAWIQWHPVFDRPTQRRMGRAVRRGINFLLGAQEKSGAFGPLWFGNQFAPDEVNRVYGTSRVVMALAATCRAADFSSHAAAYLRESSVEWLINAQNEDGGWGGERGVASTVEETALGLEALGAAKQSGVSTCDASIIRGTEWLVSRVESGAWREPSPIGFYFAKLWYFERLYPMIFSVAALRAVSESPGGAREKS
jgi:squalene-hopene/tetraprenyl-beta-curcumene cyclase